MKQAAIYTRVSSQRQKEEKTIETATFRKDWKL